MSILKEVELQNIKKQSQEAQDKYLNVTTSKRNNLIQEMKMGFNNYFEEHGFQVKISNDRWQASYNTLEVIITVPVNNSAQLGNFGSLNISSRGSSKGDLNFNILFNYEQTDFGEDGTTNNVIHGTDLDSLIARENKTYSFFKNRLDKIDSANLKLRMIDNHKKTKNTINTEKITDILNFILN